MSTRKDGDDLIPWWRSASSTPPEAPDTQPISLPALAPAPEPTASGAQMTLTRTRPAETRSARPAEDDRLDVPMPTQSPAPARRRGTRILAMASALLAAGLAFALIRNPSSYTMTTAVQDPEKVIALSPTPNPPSVSPLATEATEATEATDAGATEAGATEAGAGSAGPRADLTSVRASTPATVQAGDTAPSTGRPSAIPSRPATPAAAVARASTTTAPTPSPSAAPPVPGAGSVSIRVHLQLVIEVSWTAAQTNGLKTSCTVTLREDDGKSVRKVKADTGAGRFVYAPSTKVDRDPRQYQAEKTCKIDGDSTTVLSSGVML